MQETCPRTIGRLAIVDVYEVNPVSVVALEEAKKLQTHGLQSTTAETERKPMACMFASVSGRSTSRIGDRQ